MPAPPRKGHPRRARGRFLAATTEHERVAAFSARLPAAVANDTSSAFVSSWGTRTRSFADVDDLGAGPTSSITPSPTTRVHDDVSIGDQPRRPHRQQLGSPGPAPTNQTYPFITFPATEPRVDARR